MFKHNEYLIRTNTLLSRIYDGDLSAITNLPEQDRKRAIKDQSHHWTAACGGHIHILDYFHRHGGNLAAERCNALRGAARGGHVAVIAWLHAVIDITPAQRAEAVRLAGEYAHLDALKALYLNGATLDDIAKCARDTHSRAARDFLIAQRKTLSASTVTMGCMDAIEEARKDQQSQSTRMKKALRLFGL